MADEAKPTLLLMKLYQWLFNEVYNRISYSKFGYIYPQSIVLYQKSSFPRTNIAFLTDFFRGLINATVKPVCNDHLYNKMYYLWFIQ